MAEVSASGSGVIDCHAQHSRAVTSCCLPSRRLCWTKITQRSLPGWERIHSFCASWSMRANQSKR
jgi:hypothetical protein